MNAVSPRIAAAAASKRTEQDILNERIRNANAAAVGQIAALFSPAPQFGSIARVKWDERELLADVLAKVQALELALGTAAEFSSAMPSNYSALLDTLHAAVHDECVTLASLESRLENVE